MMTKDHVCYALMAIREALICVGIWLRLTMSACTYNVTSHIVLIIFNVTRYGIRTDIPYSPFRLID